MSFGLMLLIKWNSVVELDTYKTRQLSMYEFNLSNIIDNFIIYNQNNINNLSEKYSVSYKTIEIQIRLHLPYYDEKEILNNKHLLYIIFKKLIKYFNFYAYFNKKILIKNKHILNSKLKGKNDIFLQVGKNIKINLYFKKINNHIIDKVFQKKLHYIKRYRKDTLDSFGFFVNEDDLYPICYASISKCDRKYLFNALKKTNIITNNDYDTILIMTRAFSMENAPKNLMSKFFDKIYNYYKYEDNNYTLILTALNPTLGFKGSIFKGSSYFQFAKSPMVYNYDDSGLYINRKSKLNKVTYLQKIKTPSIIWLARGITKSNQIKLEKNKLIYDILDKEYIEG